MNSFSTGWKLQVIFSIFLISMLVAHMNTVRAKEGPILQDEFAGLLFDRLEIAEKSEVLTKEQKILALEELRFAPEAGYKIGEPLTNRDLVTILVRIYGLEKELSSPYTHEDALKLLVDRKTMKEDDKLEMYVLYDQAVLIIAQIEPVRQYRPGLILLPRVPSGPPASPTE